MAGLFPAIHVFFRALQDVDAGDKRGHDAIRQFTTTGVLSFTRP
jgi:hypothetical protein